MIQDARSHEIKKTPTCFGAITINKDLPDDGASVDK
jgi:hypothetical protein